MMRIGRTSDHYDWEKEIQARAPGSSAELGVVPPRRRGRGGAARVVDGLPLWAATSAGGFYYLSHNHPTWFGVAGAAVLGGWVPDAASRLRKRYTNSKARHRAVSAERQTRSLRPAAERVAEMARLHDVLVARAETLADGRGSGEGQPRPARSSS